ncbi:hypothetical protein WQ57_07950 [Mesobacillus campisalis]|uniref:Uncharacterized protein n=1 Tax=Mesobacillus campisalis TaxID=1408103 RepID=A0A0M2SWI2_9BACI|nr:hypothetical protein [Mesobacillus campisalis]KKK38528.1 hypothetical protein WQ57_07950 [Mesobacillus campisalis]
MELERLKAILTASHMKEFAEFVDYGYIAKPQLIPNREKHFRLKMLMEEFNFLGVANELLRLNQYVCEQRETKMLLDRFSHGLRHVAEYVSQNQEDLYLFSGRIYTLEHDIELFGTLSGKEAE